MSSAAPASSPPVQLWYHTLDLPGWSEPTPGWFDLRPIVSGLPWPDVAGLRCLDVATYDGFFAFELERRGAASVLATDIGDHTSWDWPAMVRADAEQRMQRFAGEKGSGFEVARAALGSRVEKVEANVYDLSPELVGTFDVVVLGSLLLHLRDPVRALEAIRSVTRGVFLSVEAVSLPLSLLLPRRPVAQLAEDDLLCQWWTTNTAGHRRLLEMAGFEVLAGGRPFLEPFGTGHSASAGLRLSPAEFAARALSRTVLGGIGVPHVARLARPRL